MLSANGIRPPLGDGLACDVCPDKGSAPTNTLNAGASHFDHLNEETTRCTRPHQHSRCVIAWATAACLVRTRGSFSSAPAKGSRQLINNVNGTLFIFLWSAAAIYVE
jgi:hypothetical protein